MTYEFIGFVIGMFVGIFFGFVLCALAVVASKENHQSERQEDMKNDRQ